MLFSVGLCVSKVLFFFKGGDFLFSQGWKKHTFLQALVEALACVACKCVCFCIG